MLIVSTLYEDIATKQTKIKSPKSIPQDASANSLRAAASQTHLYAWYQNILTKVHY
jgi:hypothetical protein